MQKSHDVWWWSLRYFFNFFHLYLTSCINTDIWSGFVSDIFNSSDTLLLSIFRRKVRYLCCDSVRKVYRISREWREKFSTTFVNTLKVIDFIGVWTEFLIDFPIKYLFSHGDFKRSFARDKNICSRDRTDRYCLSYIRRARGFSTCFAAINACLLGTIRWTD